jgi:hypothetical protein
MRALVLSSRRRSGNAEVLKAPLGVFGMTFKFSRLVAIGETAVAGI